MAVSGELTALEDHIIMRTKLLSVLFLSMAIMSTFSFEADARKKKYPNGDVYDGGWKNDAPNGQGTMTYANGDVYIGGWLNGEYHGKGKKIFVKRFGERLKEIDGEWVNGLLSGDAKVTYFDGIVQDGQWKAGNFVSGFFSVDDRRTITGFAEVDAFVGDASLSFDSGYNYEGTASFPLNFKSVKDVIEGIRFDGDGLLSNGQSLELEGTWKNSQIISGRVLVNNDDYYLSGSLDDDSFDGELKHGNVKYSGLFSQKDKYGLFHSFKGEYVIKVGSTVYKYNGILEENRPTDGELAIGGSSKTIHIEYDANNNASINVVNAKAISVLYKNNEQLFEIIKQGQAPQYPAGFKALNGKVFTATINNNPVEGYYKLLDFAFLGEGIVYIHERYGKEEKQIEFKAPERRMITCPSCHGEGTTIEHGYTVSGEAYSRRIVCPVCNGNGKTDSEIANLMRDFQNAVYAEAGKELLIIGDRRVHDIVQDNIKGYYKYSLSGNDIDIEYGEGSIILRISNGTLVSRRSTSLVAQPIPNSKELYEVIRQRGLHSSLISSDAAIFVDPLNNPFLSFTFMTNQQPLRNYWMLYRQKGNYLDFETNATVKRNAYDEETGIGQIDLDREIEGVYLGKEFPSISGVEAGRIWLNGKASLVQVPATVSSLYYGNNIAVKGIILTSARPPKVQRYTQGNSSEKGIVFYIPEQYITQYQADPYFRRQKLQPIRPTSVKYGMIMTDSPTIQDVLFVQTSGDEYVESFDTKHTNEVAIPIDGVDYRPLFNNGDVGGFVKWVQDHIVYPQALKDAGIQGRVTVSFVVDSKGNVCNVKVLQGIDKTLDEEAVRVVSSSPKWMAGSNDGEFVAVEIKIPVMFRL